MNKNCVLMILLILFGLFFLWLFGDLDEMKMNKIIVYPTDISDYQNEYVIESSKALLSSNESLYCLEKHSYNLQHSGYIEYVFVISSKNIDCFISNNEELISNFAFMDKKHNLIGGDVENTGYYIAGNKVYFHIANRNYTDLVGADYDYCLYCQTLKKCFESIFND